MLPVFAFGKTDAFDSAVGAPKPVQVSLLAATPPNVAVPVALAKLLKPLPPLLALFPPKADPPPDEAGAPPNTLAPPNALLLPNAGGLPNAGADPNLGGDAKVADDPNAGEGRAWAAALLPPNIEGAATPGPLEPAPPNRSV